MEKINIININVDSQGHLIEPGDTVVWIGYPSVCKIQRVGRVTSNWNPKSDTLTVLANDSILGRMSRLVVSHLSQRMYDPELDVYYRKEDPTYIAYIQNWEKTRKIPWFNDKRTDEIFTVRVWDRVVTLKDRF